MLNLTHRSVYRVKKCCRVPWV